MVKQNIQLVRADRRRRAKAQEAAQQGAAAAQNTLNALLWHIITENAEAEADPNIDTEGKDVSAVLTVPVEELDKVPVGFTLNVKLDPEHKTVVIHATVQKEESKILLADGSRLHGG